MIIASPSAGQPHNAGPTQGNSQPRVRQRSRVFPNCAVDVDSPRDLSVSVDEPGAKPNHGYEPLHVLDSGFERAGPDIFLIAKKVLERRSRRGTGGMRLIVFTRSSLMGFLLCSVGVLRPRCLALDCTAQNDNTAEKRKADLLRVKQAHPFRLPMFLPAQDTHARLSRWPSRRNC